MSLMDYGQKIVALLGNLDRLTDKVTGQGEDLERLRAATLSVTQFATSLRDQAIDFRQRSDEKHEKHKQDIRELREQVAALTAVVNELSADFKRSQETAALKEELQLERMKNSLNEMKDELRNQFFTQIPRVGSGGEQMPVLKAADDGADNNKSAQ
jgi:flagellar motility protein MotE (MotC chaperone)